ncbi:MULTISPECIES: hypothetical protein [Pseudomonadaceae]|jgi:hypothetical protein|uniref:Lipoprotein n=1 Tax=Metapseudomonas otitidis TaxID=319939 RepID=A0A1I0T9A5_9GAMM|nr:MULTISPECIES: hypothetical protein [Pseudomonas]KIV67996.1 hypothetical protein SZ55_3351 [Pseudomonas sp. FeS53a]MDI6524869.1 hypothetical protein [Pseudomonas otitidis]MDV3441028.1 hypothetical protein [Pseudomonas otitidis]MEE1895520.1 hypothetical protein [Pseudomonas otitidis]MWK54376.1 hypothetical protein [Pseudomonas otitidis]
MKRAIVLAFSALVAISCAAQAQQPPLLRSPGTPAPGSPGTATPQPYSQPSPPSFPSAAPPGSPPLLVNPPTTRQADPRDERIPLLQEQLDRNSKGLGNGEKKPAP